MAVPTRPLGLLQDIDPKTLAWYGGLFAPGSGVADASGVYPSLDGQGFQPSLKENISKKQYLDALFQSMGIAGDAVYAATGPIGGTTLGAALKAPGKIQKTIKALPTPKNKTIYHATDAKFDEFDVNKTADGSIWFSDNKKMIEAGYDGVGKRKYTIERLIDEDKLKLANWDDADKYMTPELIEMGFDGVKYTEAGKKDVTYQIFNPEKLSKLVNKIK